MFKVKLERDDLKVEHPIHPGFIVRLKDLSELEFTQHVASDYMVLGKALSEKTATADMMAAPLAKIVAEVEGLNDENDRPITVAELGIETVARLLTRKDFDFTEKIPDPADPEAPPKVKRTFFWDQVLITAQRLYTDVPEKKA